MAVKFYRKVEDQLMKFAVIISKTEGQYVFCKHKDRDTLEVPGGHRERGETILNTAKRELYEETGAIDYDIKPICVYSVSAKDSLDGEESFGMLYYADIRSFEKELHSEIEKIIITDNYRKIGLIRTYSLSLWRKRRKEDFYDLPVCKR